MASRKTRFKGLAYRNDAPGLWRFVDLSTDASVGPQYATKDELLADTERYAQDAGWTSAPSIKLFRDNDTSLLSECFELLIWVQRHRGEAERAKQAGKLDVPATLNVEYVKKVCEEILPKLNERLNKI